MQGKQNKVAQVTIQEPKKGSFVSFVIAARPQTTNESSSFSSDIATFCCKWTQVSNAKASFVGTITDGVSTETSFLDQSIDDFLEGKQADFSMTDCNHNAKSIRYQLLSSLCTIGQLRFDPGLLCLTSLSKDTWRIKDFADNEKVLKLASYKTVSMLGQLENKDGRQVAATCLFLYFLRMKIYAINVKSLPCEQRVIYLTSALCFFTTVKGISIITMRNLVREIVPTLFLMAREDCPHPRLATSEPLEHKFGTICASHGEFTSSMFPGIVEKEAIANAAMSESSLKNG